ncbi:MAG: hypothetical protein H0W62_07215 [Chitinophagales bacterium]|nr:hypothetical protein [Chitinophagales bacterium]
MTKFCLVISFVDIFTVGVVQPLQKNKTKLILQLQYLSSNHFSVPFLFARQATPNKITDIGKVIGDAADLQDYIYTKTLPVILPRRC